MDYFTNKFLNLEKITGLGLKKMQRDLYGPVDPHYERWQYLKSEKPSIFIGPPIEQPFIGVPREQPFISGPILHDIPRGVYRPKPLPKVPHGPRRLPRAEDVLPILRREPMETTFSKTLNRMTQNLPRRPESIAPSVPYGGQFGPIPSFQERDPELYRMMNELGLSRPVPEVTITTIPRPPPRPPVRVYHPTRRPRSRSASTFARYKIGTTGAGGETRFIAGREVKSQRKSLSSAAAPFEHPAPSPDITIPGPIQMALPKSPMPGGFTVTGYGHPYQSTPGHIAYRPTTARRSNRPAKSLGEHTITSYGVPFIPPSGQNRKIVFRHPNRNPPIRRPYEVQVLGPTLIPRGDYSDVFKKPTTKAPRPLKRTESLPTILPPIVSIPIAPQYLNTTFGYSPSSQAAPRPEVIYKTTKEPTIFGHVPSGSGIAKRLREQSHLNFTERPDTFRRLKFDNPAKIKEQIREQSLFKKPIGKAPRPPKPEITIPMIPTPPPPIYPLPRLKSKPKRTGRPSSGPRYKTVQLLRHSHSLVGYIGDRGLKRTRSEGHLPPKSKAPPERPTITSKPISQRERSYLSRTQSFWNRPIHPPAPQGTKRLKKRKSESNKRKKK